MRDPSHLTASIRSAIARAGVVTFVAASLTFAAPAIAGAQTLPAADPQTPVTDQAAPAPAVQAPAPAEQPNPTVAQAPAPKPPARPAPPPPPLSHLPIIDLVVIFTQPGYYSNKPAVQGAGGVDQLGHYDPIDLGGTVRIPVTRKFSLFFDRIVEGTINEPLERQLLPTANYPRDTRDAILQYHGTYIFNRFVTVDAGNSFRHRIYSFGAAGNGTLLTNISARPFPYTLSSTEHHFSYLTVSYTTKPWKEFFNSSFVFTEQGEVQNVDHNVAILCSAAMVAGNLNKCGGRLPGQVGYLDENPNKSKYYTTTQGVTWILPLDVKHGVTYTMNERWGYLNFYQNQPYPWFWNSALVYQLNKRFSPGFTLSLRKTDYHEGLVGAPFAGNALNPKGGFVHVGSWDIIGTFHFDTKTLFH